MSIVTGECCESSTEEYIIRKPIKLRDVHTSVASSQLPMHVAKANTSITQVCDSNVDLAACH